MEYEITIIETLEKTVKIKADDLNEALRKTENDYNNEKYVLGAADFTSVDFKVVGAKND